MAYKMKGHSLPGPHQRKSPAKHTVTVGPEKGTQAGSQSGADTHNAAHSSGQFVDDSHNTKTTLENKKVAEAKKKGKESSSPATQKSPAKCPLVAALAPMAMQAVGNIAKKKQEE
jgi:hypothetical protein